MVAGLVRDMDELSSCQLRFLRLHQLRDAEYIEEWGHMFRHSMVRAMTNKGKTAAASRDEINEMVRIGLLRQGHGGSFHVTDLGRAYQREEELV